MKKLLFSTMAVLAFSVSGMANTIEIEDSGNYQTIDYSQVVNNKINLDENIAEISESGTPCADAAMTMYNFLRDTMNNTHAQAWRLSEIAFQHCMRNTYGSSGFPPKSLSSN